MIALSQNNSISQSLGRDVKCFIEEARDGIKLHLTGRLVLAGMALAATAESVSRFAFYCLAQVAALFTFYQSTTINKYVKDQVKMGFAAAVISSASFFSLLSPSFFTTLKFPNDPPPLMFRLGSVAFEDEAVRLQTQVIAEVIKVPFKLIALSFQIPFYCVQLTIQLMILPVRIALLPIQLFCYSFTYQPTNYPDFRLN